MLSIRWRAFQRCVVAEIVSAEQHPDADKLRVCQVDTGSETVQIVCGAPNARAGLKAPLARWARFCRVISRSSRPSCAVWSRRACCVPSRSWVCRMPRRPDGTGRRCAGGRDLRDYLQLDDKVIEIGLTPNRADCLGVPVSRGRLAC